MTTAKPYKPWRVYGPGDYYEDRRSETAAYAHAGAITRAGNVAKVYHWEQGRWVKYEVIEPQEG